MIGAEWKKDIEKDLWQRQPKQLLFWAICQAQGVKWKQVNCS
jgi:hypothetical protein